MKIDVPDFYLLADYILVLNAQREKRAKKFDYLRDAMNLQEKATQLLRADRSGGFLPVESSGGTFVIACRDGLCRNSETVKYVPWMPTCRY